MESVGLEVRSSQTPPEPTKPPPDMVLALGFFIITVGFAYLFMEVWYPIKQGGAVFGLIMLVAGFYFGTTYAKNMTGGGRINH